MARVLILGGTGWLGREIARTLRDDGAEVVCLARGESGAAPDGVELVTADRRAADAYADRRLGGAWDEVIELAYAPDLVRPALTALAAHAAHWTLISTVSVYARNDQPGADESAALVEPRDLEAYPDAKVAAERASAAALGDRLLIVRPGLIVGPGDPSDRFGYWPARLLRGGRVVVPDVTDRFVQVIDVADLARAVAGVNARRRVGVVNAVGPAHPMAEFFRAAREATGFDGELVPADDDTLRAHGVSYWAGPRSLPLWLPVEDAGFARRDGSAFLGLDGAARPLAETLARTAADEAARGLDRPRRAGLTAAEETEILTAIG